MAYNSTGYNTVAYSVTRVFESGGLVATGEVSTTDTSLSIESGTITSQGVVSLISSNGYNGTGYNADGYNATSGEIAFAFESGTINSDGQLNAVETSRATERGEITAEGALSITDIAFAFESGLIESTGLLSATTDAIPAVVRTYVRDALFDIAYTLDLNTTFTLSRIIEFTESNTMTEIPEIDDTITNETRRLEFTAKEDGNVKDITGASISWSLAERDNIVLSDADPEVDITIIDAQNGRFNVEVDTFDVGAGVYRQRVEIEGNQGQISRSNGVYRLQEF